MNKCALSVAKYASGICCVLLALMLLEFAVEGVLYLFGVYPDQLQTAEYKETVRQMKQISGMPAWQPPTVLERLFHLLIMAMGSVYYVHTFIVEYRSYRKAVKA